MLNIFPIQFLAPIAFTLLRICAGSMLILLGIQHIKNRPRGTIDMGSSRTNAFLFIFWGILELISGTLLFLGLYTQIGALIGLSLSLVQLILPHTFSYVGYPSRIFFTLFMFVSLSLFITGAGIFAFDLPI